VEIRQEMNAAHTIIVKVMRVYEKIECMGILQRVFQGMNERRLQTYGPPVV